MSPSPSNHFPGYRYSPRPRKEKTHCSTAAVCSLLCRGTSRGAKSIFMFHTSEQRQTNGLQLLPTKKKKKGLNGSKVFHSAPSYLMHSAVIAQSIRSCLRKLWSKHCCCQKHQSQQQQVYLILRGLSI